MKWWQSEYWVAMHSTLNAFDYWLDEQTKRNRPITPAAGVAFVASIRRTRLGDECSADWRQGVESTLRSIARTLKAEYGPIG